MSVKCTYIAFDMVDCVLQNIVNLKTSQGQILFEGADHLPRLMSLDHFDIAIRQYEMNNLRDLIIYSQSILPPGLFPPSTSASLPFWLSLP